jgi:hypothetical protein
MVVHLEGKEKENNSKKNHTRRLNSYEKRRQITY